LVAALLTAQTVQDHVTPEALVRSVGRAAPVVGPLLVQFYPEFYLRLGQPLCAPAYGLACLTPQRPLARFAVSALMAVCWLLVAPQYQIAPRHQTVPQWLETQAPCALRAVFFPQALR